MLIILLSFSTEKFISTSQFIIDSTRKISLTSRQLQVYRMHNIMMKWIQVELLKCTLDFTIWICSEFLYTLRILFHLNPYSVATKFGKKSDNNFDNFILKRPILCLFLECYGNLYHYWSSSYHLNLLTSSSIQWWTDLSGESKWKLLLSLY